MDHKSEHFTVQRKTPPKATSSPNITAEESWVVQLWEHFRGQDWWSFALAQFVKRPSWGQCQVHRWPIEEASSFQLGLHILFSQRKKNCPEKELVLKNLPPKPRSVQCKLWYYHLQGWASLAQTGNGQHAKWLKRGWVAIWRILWACDRNKMTQLSHPVLLILHPDSFL